MCEKVEGWAGFPCLLGMVVAIIGADGQVLQCMDKEEKKMKKK